MKTCLKEKLPESFVDKITECYGEFEKLNQILPDNAEIKKEAQFFSILSDPTRLKVLKALAKEEICVCVISDILQLDQTLISHHLSKLKYLDLIDERREGKWIFYRAKKQVIEFFEDSKKSLTKIRK